MFDPEQYDHIHRHQRQGNWDASSQNTTWHSCWDLGVCISNDLKALQQCVQACSKANRILGVLNRTIKCKDDSNFICFYKSVIRPHLEFCTASWSPHYAKDKL